MCSLLCSLGSSTNPHITTWDPMEFRVSVRNQHGGNGLILPGVFEETSANDFSLSERCSPGWAVKMYLRNSQCLQKLMLCGLKQQFKIMLFDSTLTAWPDCGGDFFFWSCILWGSCMLGLVLGVLNCFATIKVFFIWGSGPSTRKIYVSGIMKRELMAVNLTLIHCYII